MSPRVTVFSRRQVEQRVWQASQYEFEDVVLDVDDAQLLAPPGRRPSQVGAVVQGARNRARKAVRLPRTGLMSREPDVRPADLFFAMFAAPHEIADLAAVRPYLGRFGVKIAYLVEMWGTQVQRSADYLRQLRGFDHVFVFNRNVVEAVQEISGVPCSYLAYAADTLRFAPVVPWPTRYSDVTSYGRRTAGGTHAALVAAMEAGRLHYTFDTVRGPFEVTDYAEHRLSLARLLQRSRYVVVHKINDTVEKLGLTAGEEMLTTRYFEAAPTGAVILGTAPDLPDYHAAFDWPDALVTIPVPAPGIEQIIAELDADPERVHRARVANVVQSLRRHDWVHRWQEVLQVAGLEPDPRLDERLARLTRRAEEAERAAGTRPVGG